MRICIYCITIAILSCSLKLARATPPAGQTWNLAWSDDFDGTNLNTSLWGYGQKPWGTTDNSPCLITPEDTYLTNGIAGLTNGALVDRCRMGAFTGNNKTYDFSCGWAYSKTWLAYGYLEMRAEFPVGKGQWPAWWMLRSGWPPEFDVAEFRGASGPSSDYMTEAVYDEAAQWNTTTLGGDYTGWHTYGFEWGPGYLKWFIDGTLTKTVYDPDIPTQPMYVILSGGLDSTADATTGFPNYFVIDYFRWYQASTNVPPGGTPVIEKAVTSDSQVTLYWAGVLGATGYKISRASVSGGPYTLIDTTSGINATTCTDNDVVDFNQYYYVVSAVNSAGEGTNSSEVSAMPTPPALSQNRPATASSYQATHDPFYGNDGTNTTRWTASGASFPQWWKVDLGSVQDIKKVAISWENSSAWSYKYRIEVSTNDVNYATVVDQTSRTATGDSADVFSALARYVRVTVTGQGNGGWASFYECQVFGLPMFPAAPTTLMATGSDGIVNLTWLQSDGPGVTSNTVYRSTLSSGPFNPVAMLPATTSYSDDTVTNGFLYFYMVSALNAGGEGTPSGVASARPVSTIPPQAVIANNAGGLELSWPMANTGWRLQVQTNEPGIGLGTNWTDVLGSTATNRMTITLDPSNGAVFYRLVYSP